MNSSSNSQHFICEPKEKSVRNLKTFTICKETPQILPPEVSVVLLCPEVSVVLLPPVLVPLVCPEVSVPLVSVVLL